MKLRKAFFYHCEVYNTSNILQGSVSGIYTLSFKNLESYENWLFESRNVLDTFADGVKRTNNINSNYQISVKAFTPLN